MFIPKLLVFLCFLITDIFQSCTYVCTFASYMIDLIKKFEQNNTHRHLGNTVSQLATDAFFWFWHLPAVSTATPVRIWAVRRWMVPPWLRMCRLQELEHQGGVCVQHPNSQLPQLLCWFTNLPYSVTNIS
jgi:hypothetical protein